MPISNVALTNTFDEWRVVTNQTVVAMNDVLADGGTTIRNVRAGFANANSVLIGTLNVSSTLVAAFGRANTANITADAAFGRANTANITADAAFGRANTANITADAAFGRANTANITADAAFGRANVANTTANIANTTSVAAFSRANTALTIANLAFDSANTRVNTLSVITTTTGDTAPVQSVSLSGSIAANGRMILNFNVTLASPVSPVVG